LEFDPRKKGEFMKKMRFLALAVLLVALAANGMVSYPDQPHAMCDNVPAPNDLCAGSMDTGCSGFCTTDPSCDGFGGVFGSCSSTGACICRGIPQP
jgi:hypothetical protein